MPPLAAPVLTQNSKTPRKHRVFAAAAIPSSARSLFSPPSVRCPQSLPAARTRPAIRRRDYLPPDRPKFLSPVSTQCDGRRRDGGSRHVIACRLGAAPHGGDGLATEASAKVDCGLAVEFSGSARPLAHEIEAQQHRSARLHRLRRCRANRPDRSRDRCIAAVPTRPACRSWHHRRRAGYSGPTRQRGWPRNAEAGRRPVSTRPH